MARRGTARERQVRDILQSDGWIVIRAAGSLGPVDLAALRRGMPPRLIQVKADERGPWHNFQPADRAIILDTAYAAGAEPWLVWCRNRRPAVWIHGNQWPK